jgi:hypothetical protein
VFFVSWRSSAESEIRAGEGEWPFSRGGTVLPVSGSKPDTEGGGNAAMGGEDGDSEREEACEARDVFGALLTRANRRKRHASCCSLLSDSKGLLDDSIQYQPVSTSILIACKSARAREGGREGLVCERSAMLSTQELSPSFRTLDKEMAVRKASSQVSCTSTILRPDRADPLPPDSCEQQERTRGGDSRLGSGGRGGGRDRLRERGRDGQQGKGKEEGFRQQEGQGQEEAG